MAEISISGGCQLQYVSATQITLVPFNGSNIQIAGIIYSIPAGGISAANTSVYVDGTPGQNLAASTLYYVYLFNNAGVLTVDYSMTSHASDTAAGNVGIEIKSGDNTRSLIGMVYTNSSSQFSDSGANRLVASWFNRRQKMGAGNFTANRTTTSNTLVELNSEIRVSVLTWGADAIVAHGDISTHTNASGNVTTGAFGLDSGLTAFGGAHGASLQSAASINMNMSAPYSPTEGFHFVTVLGSISSGTATWQASAQSGLLFVTTTI